MSAGLSESRMLKLMAYADGELDGAERAEVESWLATDIDAIRFANEIAGLGDFVKTGHASSEDAKAVASFDIADAVMAAVKEEKSENAKPGSVVSLDAARAARQKNFKFGAAVAAALALAASVFVMTRNKEEAPLARAPIPNVQPSPNASAEPGVDVDLVETGGDSVRVFYLSNESNPTTSVVVWVDESGGK
jgi:anti-sigma factor RsiW